MTTSSFNVKQTYLTAVSSGLEYLRDCLLTNPRQTERWLAQKSVIINNISEGMDYPQTRADAITLLIDLLPVMERWGVLYDYLQLAQKALALEPSPEQYGQVLLLQGRLYSLNRNFSDAIAQLEAALALASAHQLDHLAALAHYRLANAHLGNQAVAQAKTHGYKAMQLLSETPSRMLAALHNSLGLMDLELGLFESSEAQLKEALSQWQQLGDATETARIYLNLGVLYLRQARWAEATASYELSLKELAVTESKVDRLKVLNGLGSMYYETNEREKAEAVFRQGLQEALALEGTYHLRGSLTHNLGNTLLAMERLEEAQVYLTRAVAIWEQANDSLQQANSVGTLGELHEEEEAWETAVSCYDAAIELLESYPDHQWALKLKANFARARARCADQLDGKDKPNSA